MIAPAAVETRLNQDLFFFAEHGPLLIKGKTTGLASDEDAMGGSLIKWKPNIAQRFMQWKAEEQRRTVGGWVRLLLVKGRQQGGSTWADARAYHRVRSVPGTSAAIIAHETKATANLFKMVETFHNNVDPLLRPELGKSNVNQMTFPGINSEFRALTAGNEDAGRSGTAQVIHGSEVGYWPNAYAIQDSLLESVALLPGTEIILESTGNGPVGLFYDKVMLAIRKLGDYVLVFVPWYWQEEYERAPSLDFMLDPEEQDYAKAHFDGKIFPFEAYPVPPWRVLRKMAWRRAKILDFATSNGGVNLEAGHAKFRRIYPSFALEAFQATGIGIIRPEAILAARKNSNLVDDVAPIIAGVDPAGDSDSSDRTVIAIRKGRVLLETMVFPRMTPMRLADIIVEDVIKKKGASMVFVDRGYGEGTIDRVRQLHFGQYVIGVAFNETSLEPDIYLNKRSEIIMKAAKWVNDGGVRIPDDDDIGADLACMPLEEETANGLKFIKTKREIKKLLGRSPDIYDAVALTFAHTVHVESSASRFTKAVGNGSVASKKGGGPLKSMARFRGGS